MDTDTILKKLTLKEKAALLSGESMWETKSVPRLNIPSVTFADGPHGLRKEANKKSIGLNEGIPATCFPPACTLACTWNRDMLFKVSMAIGEEARANDVSVVLGPAVNIKRSPLCGRNFEYFSEDPYLTGELAASYIKGMQQTGVGACIKHFAANNQETIRQTSDSLVDERALREIYLYAFETAVRKAEPYTVMCSYNKLNGEYLSSNKRLLTDILRDEWGFKGLVVTDWGAIDDRIKAVKAGCDLEMPANKVFDKELLKAVKKSEVTEEELDKCVKRVLELAFKTCKKVSCDYEKNDSLARSAAAEGSVLLKNEGTLPLHKNKPILVIGEFAKIPRYQGSGSSKITPTRLESFLDALDARGISYVYKKGYDISKRTVDDDLINEAAQASKDASQVLIFAGLTPDIEAEAIDRKNMCMPPSHDELIRRVAKVNKNTAVYVMAGSAVLMPWIGGVNAVMYGYLGGQAGAQAAADVLFGDVSPSGKLAETFPVKEEDCPVKISEDEWAEYKESIFTGYRYYSTLNIKPLFCFGHGLSYAEFEYSDLSYKDGAVYLNVKNKSPMRAKETVELYVSKKDKSFLNPETELKGFFKADIPANGTVRVKIELDERAFAFYNTLEKRWCVKSGEYEIKIGSSSEDIRLSTTVTVEGEDAFKLPDYYNLEDLKTFPFYKIYPLPEKKEKEQKADRHTRLYEIKDTFIGGLFCKIAAGVIEASDEQQAMVMRKAALDIPLGSMFNMSPVKIPMSLRKIIIFIADRQLKRLKKKNKIF